MYLPLRTEGYDGRIRPGLAALLLLFILMQAAVWRDTAKKAAAVSLLKYGSSSCPAGQRQIKTLAAAEDLGILKAAGIAIQRDPIVTDRLERMRKASLLYKSALVADDPSAVNFLTALFTHAGWLHFFLTLWFLYPVGAALERRWGTGLFLGVFMGCGVFGETAYQIIQGHAAAGFAMVGPDAALGGLMGAYAVTHWDSGVEVLNLSLGLSGVRARFSVRMFLALWVGTELVAQILIPDRGCGLALPACIAGLVAGALIGKVAPSAFVPSLSAMNPAMKKAVRADGLGF